MNTRNPSTKYIISTLLIMAFIFYQSSLTDDLSGNQSGLIMELIIKVFGGEPSETMHFLIRKLAHFTEYAALGISLGLLIWSTENQQKEGDDRTTQEVQPAPGKFREGIIAWAIGAVYAVTDELHQYLVPGRSCEIRDMLIDSAGVLLGVVIAALLKYKKWQKSLE